MITQTAPCDNEYENALTAETILIDGRKIGDLVNFDSQGDQLAFSVAWSVILTCAMRPYSNGCFATREGALNYMVLVGGARGGANAASA
jgi:hypothetical protein